MDGFVSLVYVDRVRQQILVVSSGRLNEHVISSTTYILLCI